MEQTYQIVRTGLFIITIIPLFIIMASNSTWEGFLDDLLG